MKPICLNNNLRYLICIVENSTDKKAGNLFLHNKDKSTYEEYNFITRRWKQDKIEILTEREKAILMLAQQCKNTVEIANELCKGQHTIRNQIKALFNNCLLYTSPSPRD